MQLIHDARAHLYQPMSMPQQLPQIPIHCVRDPDPRKAIFHQEPQQQLRILPIGLLLPHSFRANLRCVPDPQLKLQVRSAIAQTSVRVRWLPFPHAPFVLERAVKLLRLFAVSQSPFPALACFCIHKCNLLKARMIVTTYNQHVRLLSSEPLVGLRLQSLLGPGSRHCYGIISLIARQHGYEGVGRPDDLKSSVWTSCR